VKEATGLHYITPKEAAAKWGISQRRVHTLCQEGRLRGVERHGWTWLIPATANKPGDARVKSGRHIKPKSQLPLLPTGDGIIFRSRLVEKIRPPGSKLTYIHAGAGYGKTTLLLQYAQGRNDVVWLSLDDRDSDMPYFLYHLESSLREKLGKFEFYAADYIPFAPSERLAAILLPALLTAISQRRLSILIDDVHILHNPAITALLTAWATACPPTLSLVMASRHEPWDGLLPLKLTGKMAEFTKQDLCFNREEAEHLLGFGDDTIYEATEGWTLALQSYRLAAKDGRSLPAARLYAEQDLYRYLLQEIITQLPAETQFFLKATSGLPLLEPAFCDTLLGIGNSRELLESLVLRNIFTARHSDSIYCHHALFRSFLQQISEGLDKEILQKALTLCYAGGNYVQAAEYALLLEDSHAVQNCISAMLALPFAWNHNHRLKKYFDFLEKHAAGLSPRVMLAKGMVLSDLGDFHQAETYLHAAIPHLSGDEQSLYRYAMTHMARVLRNKVSFAESTRCLDALLPLPPDAPMQDWYAVVIEKIYNLTMTSRLNAALELTMTMVEQCLNTGAVGVKAWFERYLTTIYFYLGDYKSCLQAYEKSLSIPVGEQDWLMRHSVGAYAAKAYQITGQGEKALPLLDVELARLKHLGLYEEYSIYYLIYMEILHAEELLKRYCGLPFDFSIIDRHLVLAKEYAVLNRSTRDHYLFINIWKLCAGLLAQPDKASQSISEILTLLERATPFFQTLAYGRMANALDTLGLAGDQCKHFFRQSIRIGEDIGSYAYAAVAYGSLAAIYLREGDRETAQKYTRHFLELCRQYDHRYYLRFKPLYAPVLKLAAECGITPEFTQEMLSYGGYTVERVYLHTLGAFSIAPAYDRKSRVKIRTQKARELLAYLLEHRTGVTREQVCRDVWENSEANAANLFHTRRGEIRRAFESLGAANPVMYENGLYRLNVEEIICDLDLFRQAAAEFRRRPEPANAQKVVDCYTGRYLDDMEALWAESARLEYEDSFLAAAETLLASYRASGERAKTRELLRRCTALSYHGHTVL
jgi:LuxR family maltose regulon positive regulatory protein